MSENGGLNGLPMMDEPIDLRVTTFSVKIQNCTGSGRQHVAALMGDDFPNEVILRGDGKKTGSGRVFQTFQAQ